MSHLQLCLMGGWDLGLFFFFFFYCFSFHIQNSLKLIAKCSPYSRRKTMNLYLLEKGGGIQRVILKSNNFFFFFFYPGSLLGSEVEDSRKDSEPNRYSRRLWRKKKYGQRELPGLMNCRSCDDGFIILGFLFVCYNLYLQWNLLNSYLCSISIS